MSGHFNRYIGICLGVLLAILACGAGAAETKCCEKLIIRSSQRSELSKYKGKTFHVFASDRQKDDPNFRGYMNSLARAMVDKLGIFYTPSAMDADFRVYVYYDSTGLPFVVDKNNKSDVYMPKSCLYNPDARLARHKLFLDVVDSKTGRAVFEYRSTVESVLNFSKVAYCMMEASMYDVTRSSKNRVSICDSCGD